MTEHDPELEHDSDLMWSPLFEEVWHKIKFVNRPHYSLRLLHDQKVPNGRWYYQIECQRPDSITGKLGIGRGAPGYLDPDMDSSQLTRTAMALLLAYDEHEARECFEFDGVKVYGPHMDIWLLHAIGTRRQPEPNFAIGEGPQPGDVIGRIEPDGSMSISEYPTPNAAGMMQPPTDPSA